MPFVLDASVALSWCFPDESNDYGEAILRRFREDSAIVPAIWPLEVTNALLVGHRRNRMTLDQIHTAARLLSALKIEVDTISVAQVFNRTVEIALKHGLTAYDTAYLELAQRRRCPLATTDRRLCEAAQSVGLTVL
ncbi:MAG: type II toxin-antitoxin system VapC family toxin [Alicyclobacillus sp.]|nr:type II toxin-antitoxin system VapC family toxin [Alicyclobacillus sp.]